MKQIAFFIKHFTERGTESSVFDYAKYNEEILGNKSYILCFNEITQKAIGLPETRISYAKFKNRFEIVEINNFTEMPDIIDKYKLDFFYTQTHGDHELIYMFEKPEMWIGTETRKLCKTIKHCVFCTDGEQGDFYISISNCLNNLYNTRIPVIPYIVPPPISNPNNLRGVLNIPQDAIVLGRHGGAETFDIPFVHNAIKNFVINGPTNVYFLFMNTYVFFEHPRIIHLPPTTELEIKTMFINSCDAMIHARYRGETFGLAVAEFSMLNKPVITYSGSREREHIDILGENAILYRDEIDLLNILINIGDWCNKKTKDWNSYRKFYPENVMSIFDSMIFSAT